ncbi:cytochrome C assembly protein [Roseiconus nitratireducens]|uniref:Cytochrome C assembly protein n=1 Tax=Roseiconus nitratireducens TaxID=2605748 RepID=A0A5M6CU54_9BACT|nr:cytochrome c biogenesis protein CcsA [Roseiconus nitratireducens]KAA5538764.1 cytochrome C assembly protein [Roseiconus nitratireducens]
MDILRQISVTCFFSSYVVALLLELSRLIGSFRFRTPAVVVMMVIGLFTHISYLFLRALDSGLEDDRGLLSSWAEWSLLLALGLAICFLIAYLRRPDTIISFFFLPLILLTIGLGIFAGGWAPFSRSEAVNVWRSIHGLAMMIGTGAVLVGFLAGVMYLVQSWRLKHKRAGSKTFRLPTLETLDRANRRALVTSTTSVAIGVVAGVILNLNEHGRVNWTEGGVLLSLVLFLWLVAATATEFLYSPASRGRKAFYLTLASLGFLVLALVGVIYSAHGVS